MAEMMARKGVGGKRRAARRTISSTLFVSVIVILSALSDLKVVSCQYHQVSSYNDHNSHNYNHLPQHVENNLEFNGNFPHPDQNHNPEDTESIYEINHPEPDMNHVYVPPPIEDITPEITGQNQDESVNENLLPLAENPGNQEFTELSGGTIVGEKILRLSESPYVLNTDLEVEEGGKLTVEPGVIVQFAPMVGITIRGTINAVVSDLVSPQLSRGSVLYITSMLWIIGITLVLR